MFRAILWKEWRELWILPVAAGALSAMGLFVTAGIGGGHPTVFWKMGFSLWLALFAIYIPTHLYRKEQDSNTSNFLFSQPLDRFRLWWLKFFIGITIIGAIGSVLLGTTLTAIYWLPKTGSGYSSGTALFPEGGSVFLSICFSFFCFSLSSFTSTLFKKQVRAALIAVLILSLLWAFGAMLSMRSEPVEALDTFFSQNAYDSGIRFLAFSPFFLFFSLLIFSRGSVSRQTWRRIVLAYSVSVLIMLTPAAVGMTYLSSTAKVAFRGMEEEQDEWRNRWFINQMSEDGSRILAYLAGEDLLVAIDLPRREARVLDSGNINDTTLHPEGELLFYTRMADKIFLPTKLVLTDFRGAEKQELFHSRFILWDNAPNARWSIDGALIGLTKGRLAELRDDAFVAIYDRSGNALGKHTFPALEDVSLWPLGWDAEERFYFAKEVEKKGQALTTYWRIGRDDFIPEAISFVPEDECTSIRMSPDGRWFVRTKPWGKVYEEKEKNVLRLTSVASGEDLLVSENVDSKRWSRDGETLIFSEDHTQSADQVDSASQLTLYKPETGEQSIISMEKSSGSALLPYWCESDDFWYRTDSGEYHAFSLETRQIEKVTPPSERAVLLHWVKDGQPLWQVENKLIVTERDGSNPREVFRFEGDRFFFDGEEAG